MWCYYWMSFLWPTWGLTTGSQWNYTDFGEWVRDYPACGGQKQSPLDLQFQDVPFWPNGTSEHLYVNYSLSNVTVSFSDYTLKAQFEASENVMTADHLGLNNTFLLSQLSFHWDSLDTKGSEHKINGKQFPLELHLMHYLSSCASLTDCFNVTNGVTAYAVLFQIGSPHPALQILLDAFNRSETRVLNFPVSAFLPTTGRRDFMFYGGSLTTPPCAGVVNWVVGREVMNVSTAQLAALRTIWNGQNWRPTQAYDSRVVHTSWPIPTWKYNNWTDPGLQNAQWPSAWSACGGMSQSPVDLPLALSTSHHLEEVQTTYGSQTASYLTNTGYSLQVDVSGDLIFRSRRYHLRQLHFHWGNSDDHGCEHTRAGRRFPLEMHMVHWDASFPSFTEASTADNASLLVVGVHFVNGTDNPTLNSIFDHAHEVIYPSNRSLMPASPFVLEDFLPSSFGTEFQTYHGSLTTPPCFESVQWVFLGSTLTVSSAQLQKLRVLQHSGGGVLEDNGRETQPLNGRTIEDNSTTNNGMDYRDWLFLALQMAVLLACLIYCFVRPYLNRRRVSDEGAPLLDPSAYS